MDQTVPRWVPNRTLIIVRPYINMLHKYISRWIHVHRPGNSDPTTSDGVFIAQENVHKSMMHGRKKKEERERSHFYVFNKYFVPKQEVDEGNQAKFWSMSHLLHTILLCTYLIGP